MALGLSFKIALSSDAKTLTITDRTGAYSGLQTGGFGSPNPAVSDATSATIKIAKRNSDGTFATEITVNAFNTLPSDSGGTFDILSTLGVNAATYADGIYRLIYTVAGTSGGTPFSASVTRFDILRNNIAICYQKKTANFVACECNCEEIEKEFQCFVLYMNLLKSAECCGDLNSIQKYLDKLTELCNDDCGCC